MPPKHSPPRLTHFLCIPLITPVSRSQLQRSLTTFRDKCSRVRTSDLPDGIPDQAIRPLGTLHLTLGVMSLLTEERVQSALKVLNELNLKDLLSTTAPTPENLERKDMLEPSHLDITLRGLTSMHSKVKTSCLYTAPFDPTGQLYSFCLKLRDIFTAANILVPENTGRPLLLHATILNTVYVPGVRGRGNGHGHGKNRAKLTIDATELLEDYEEFEWMKDVRVEKVAICRMGAKKGEADAGEESYVVEGEVNMP
jgi:activating signal cointegrator complex subunit 1